MENEYIDFVAPDRVLSGFVENTQFELQFQNLPSHVPVFTVPYAGR